MAEVLAEFSDVVVSPTGKRFRAQACGRPTADGLWHGWIEFVPIDGGRAKRSPRETTQPNRLDAIYWATGLTSVYLEGALQRALSPPIVRQPHAAVSIFDAPAPHLAADLRRVAAEPAILDPFAASEKGDVLLRKQLNALSARHLVNIVVAFDLSDEPRTALNRKSAGELVDLIASAVARR